MRMFNFFNTTLRGCDKAAEAGHFMLGKPIQITDIKPVPRPIKRKRQSADGVAPPASPRKSHSAKRAKPNHDGAAVAALSAPVRDAPDLLAAPQPAADCSRLTETIQFQFGLEIMLKHNELRLIEQEMAKCQVALEQLRRCHLIPYPTACPTPAQMLDIASGKGAAVRPRAGEAVPKWAAPFGVVDGPYARHYAKWLIPDPVFDGLLPEWQGLPQAQHSKSLVEGRTTRNSYVDAAMLLGKQRGSRASAGQKLHALASGYPQPKEKAGPCVLKRSDGQTVKLVCIDCQRENFSSTQGFINHCRIAHKRDFKSHEEAAVHCGHPIEVDETGPSTAAPEEKPTVSSAAPGLVHPLARHDKEVYKAVLGRIDASLQMFDQGKLHGVTTVPRGPTTAAPMAAPASFVGSDQTPYLTRLLQGKQFSGNLREQVEEAKEEMDLDDYFPAGDESEDGEQAETPTAKGWSGAASAARTPAAGMRMPVPPAMSPALLAAGSRPLSSKSHSPSLNFAVPALPPLADGVNRHSMFEDDDMDNDLSPNTTSSNNAPSLVSDDGEYDDSDDASSSEEGETDVESVSDVAEISIAEDESQGHESPRGLRHHRGSASAAVKMKKDESKHVTFVSPVRNDAKGRRKPTI
jgi:ADA HAT complex component 1